MTDNLKLKKLQGKQRELELKINKLNQSTARKERTQRLIRKGALVEKYFDIEHLTVEETEELLATFSEFVKEKKLSKFKQ